MKKLFTCLVVITLLLVFTCFSWGGENPAVNEAESIIPVKNTVTLVDLGAKYCIPCKLMEPILEELKIEYQGRAAVIFINVQEEPGQGKRFGIRSIPTQIFYDKHGQEAYRHEGFYAKNDIVKWLDMLLERE